MRLLDPTSGATLWERVEPGSIYLMRSGRTGCTRPRPRWPSAGRCGGSTWPAGSGGGASRHAGPGRAGDLARDGRAHRLPDLRPPDRGVPDAPARPAAAAERQAFVLAFYGGSNVFNQAAQILAQAGFIVLSPAVRGSFGRGREFYALIDHDLGGDEIVDLIYGARYLQERFGLEPGPDRRLGRQPRRLRDRAGADAAAGGQRAGRVVRLGLRLGARRLLRHHDLLARLQHPRLGRAEGRRPARPRRIGCGTARRSRTRPGCGRRST